MGIPAKELPMYVLKYEQGYADCQGGFTPDITKAKAFLNHDHASTAWRVKAHILRDPRRADIVDTRTGEITPVKTSR